MAQADSPASTKRRNAVCKATASGVVRPAGSRSCRLVPGPRTPSVPTTPQPRPRAPSACATHHVVEVLPLVPVTATTSNARLG